MISNQILQDTIDGLKGITRTDLCVLDTEGKVLASTLKDIDDCEDSVRAFVDSPAESQVVRGYQFFKVFDDNQLEHILMAKGETDDTYMVGKIAAFQIQNLLVAYKERFDKDNFIKNLLLDNLLLVDIYNRAKKLHIDTDVRRIVFIIETKNEKDTNALETVRNIFSAKTKDFITAVDEKNIILVKEVKSNETYDDMNKIAKVIVDMLNTEAMSSVHVSFGTIVNEIKEVSRSYKEAKMALDVGKIFYENTDIIAYSNLGIGRLIYQLPLPLCKMASSNTLRSRPVLFCNLSSLYTRVFLWMYNCLDVSDTFRLFSKNLLIVDKVSSSNSSGLLPSNISLMNILHRGSGSW